TARRTPALRSAGVIRPSGAAAPNTTVSQSCSLAMATARRDTAGTGSISEVGCLITGNGCRASNSAAPFQAGAYTVTVPAGSPVASACTNDWMPPRRGGKSLVTISVRGTGGVYRRGRSRSGVGAGGGVGICIGVCVGVGAGQAFGLLLLVLAVGERPGGQGHGEHVGDQLGADQGDPGRRGDYDRDPDGGLDEIGDPPRHGDHPERPPEAGIPPGSRDIAALPGVRAEEFHRQPEYQRPPQPQPQQAAQCEHGRGNRALEQVEQSIIAGQAQEGTRQEASENNYPYDVE